MESTDFKPFTLTELRNLQSLPHRRIRIYADGVYDLFHIGHSEQLRQAKQAFPEVELIVGVVSDEDVTRFKGRPTVMLLDERKRIVRACRWVDQVLDNVPFFADLDFINRNKIDLVAHDSSPYSFPEGEDCYAVFKKVDRFFETKRHPDVSTTAILARIFNNESCYRVVQCSESLHLGKSVVCEP